MNFKEELNIRSKRTEEIIDCFLPSEEGFQKVLGEAMNYSMRAGGKRLRPVLIQESYRLFGGDKTVIEPFMAAIEMIHTHSLVHDDLPALDNDRLRRGKETTHIAYGEAVGILCGDALLNYAYETAFKVFDLDVDSKIAGQALQVLAAKTGISGMLGGQSVDVMNEGAVLSQTELDYIYKNKTCALIECSLMIGAILAGASAAEITVMEQVGYFTGMAFQIQDDILDVNSTIEELGKPVFSDAKNQKVTYVTLNGMDGASQEVEKLTESALQLLANLPQQNDFLEKLLKFLINRKN